MTDLNAAIGLAQFRKLATILKKRAELAEYYNKNLLGINSIKLPYMAPHNKHAWFLYAILVDNAENVEKYCKCKGVELRRSWPLPIHRQPVYRSIIGGSYPVAEDITRRILNLPMYFTMTRDEQDYVIKHLKDALNKSE